MTEVWCILTCINRKSKLKHLFSCDSCEPHDGSSCCQIPNRANTNKLHYMNRNLSISVAHPVSCLSLCPTCSESALSLEQTRSPPADQNNKSHRQTRSKTRSSGSLHPNTKNHTITGKREVVKTSISLPVYSNLFRHTDKTQQTQALSAVLPQRNKNWWETTQ